MDRYPITVFLGLLICGDVVYEQTMSTRMLHNVGWQTHNSISG